VERDPLSHGLGVLLEVLEGVDRGKASCLIFGDRKWWKLHVAMARSIYIKSGLYLYRFATLREGLV
jgi:hypothetical protein